jgi:hypothetical protein
MLCNSSKKHEICIETQILFADRHQVGSLFLLLLITGYGKIISLMTLINKTIRGTITSGHVVSSTVTFSGLMVIVVVLKINLHYTKLGLKVWHIVKTEFVTYTYLFSTHFVNRNLVGII